MISYHHLLSLDQFIQQFFCDYSHSSVILTNIGVYHILAIVLMLFMIFSTLNEMTKGGIIVYNLVLLISVRLGNQISEK